MSWSAFLATGVEAKRRNAILDSFEGQKPIKIQVIAKVAQPLLSVEAPKLMYARKCTTSEDTSPSTTKFLQSAMLGKCGACPHPCGDAPNAHKIGWSLTEKNGWHKESGDWKIHFCIGLENLSLRDCLYTFLYRTTEELSSFLREPEIHRPSDRPKFIVNTKNVNTIWVHWATDWKNDTKKIQVGNDTLVVNHYRKPYGYEAFRHIETNVRDTSMQQHLALWQYDRRRQRRDRAVARRRWFLHRSGQVILSSAQLWELHLKLQQHHSRDPAFLRRVRAAMTALPWRCPCGRKNRKTAWNCPDCTGSWQYGTPVVEKNQQEVPQQYSHTQHAGGKSPRRQQHSSGQTYHGQWSWQQEPWVDSQGYQQNQGNATSPRHGRGRGGRRRSRRAKKEEQQVPMAPQLPAFPTQPPLPPPTTPPPKAATSTTLSTPAAPALAAQAPAAPTLAPPSEDALKLCSLANKLKKHQDQGMEIPEDVQEDIKDVCTRAAKLETKTMHQALTAMDHARTEYDNAVHARNQLHAQWRTFLEESVKLWQGHTSNFQAQEVALTERIQQAKQSFIQARDVMNATKIKAATMIPLDNDVNAVTVSDDDEELRDVSMAAAERIASSMTNLTETMSALHTQAQELAADEQKAKRPRVEAVPEAALGAGATEPGQPSPSHFGKAGGTLSSQPGQCTLLKRSAGSRKLRVRLSPLADVCIGDADFLQMHQTTVPHEALHIWPAKPWTFVNKDLLAKFPDKYLPLIAKQNRLGHPALVPSLVLRNPVLRVPFLQCSIMDEYANLPFVPDDPDAHQPHAPHGQPDPPGRVPDFTDNMLAAIDPAFFTEDGSGGRPLIVRTWYIHHERHVRNDAPRTFRLGPDRAFWATQIREAWTGLLDEAAPTAFTLPFPMPVRGQHIALDVIVSQGLQFPRFSGLVSAHFMDDGDGMNGFILAASFPAWVSGYAIVEVAALHDFCSATSRRVCHLFHGWDNIPLDTVPGHRMRPGHSFMVNIPRDPALEAGQPAAAASTNDSVASHAFPSGSGDNHHVEPDAAHSPDEQDDAPGTPDDSVHSLHQIGPMFNCHIYRLRHPPLHIFLRNAAGVPMLMELARRMNVVPATLLQAHPVLARMVGDQVNDFSFIVQTIADLPAASTDCLIILDVEVHFHPLQDGVQPLPASSRRVCRVPLHLTREGVLGYAGVRRYCAQQRQRCLVELNGIGWPLLRPGPVRLQHGCYLRVVVPPPFAPDDTLHAIQVAERPPAPLAAWSPASSSATNVPLTPAAPPAPVYGPNQPLEYVSNERRWRAEIQELYDEHALMEFEEEGPILYLWTWFINHETFPQCRVAKAIRLDGLSQHWRNDLLEPWADVLQIGVPVQFHVISPRPPHADLRMDTPHILIEQHQRPGRVAGVASAFFHGAGEDKLLQAAYSLPRWICTQDLIDLLGINHVCAVQRCTARSGIVPLNQFIHDDIPTGIGLELHVRPVDCSDTGASSSSEPYAARVTTTAAAHSLMQISRRWRRSSVASQPPLKTIVLMSTYRCLIGYDSTLLHLSLHQCVSLLLGRLDGLHSTKFGLSTLLRSLIISSKPSQLKFGSRITCDDHGQNLGELCNLMWTSPSGSLVSLVHGPTGTFLPWVMTC
eukprot:s5032_g1.t1